MLGTLPFYTQYKLLLLNRLHAAVNINTCQLLGAQTRDKRQVIKFLYYVEAKSLRTAYS